MQNPAPGCSAPAVPSHAAGADTTAELLTSIRDQLGVTNAYLARLDARAERAETAIRRAAPSVLAAVAAAMRNSRVRKIIGDR